MTAIRTLVVYGILLLASICDLQGVQAQQIFDAPSYVRQLHQQHIGRQPTLEEESYWVTQLRSGASAADVHAGIVASSAYFNRFQGNVNFWINGAFASVFNRSPSAQERTYWAQRYQALGADRQRWSSELLRSASSNLPPTTGQLPPSSATDLPARLTSTARLLAQSANAEVPGNAGYLLQVQTRNLESASERGEFALRAPQQNSLAAQAAYREIDAALQGVRNGLSSSQAAAPMSRLYVSQATDLVTAIGRNISYRPPIELPPPPTGGGAIGLDRATHDALSSQLATVQDQSRQVVFQLRSLSQYDYTCSCLLRDVEDFSAQADSTQSRLRLATDMTTARNDVASLQQPANRIAQQIQRGGIDSRVVQSWFEISQSLNRLFATAGLSSSQGSLYPVSLLYGNGGFPFGDPNLSPASLGAIQGSAAAALAHCDVLLSAYTPYSFYSPDVKRLETELSNLRPLIDGVRRDAGRGTARLQLDAAYAQCRQAMERVNSAWRLADSGGQLRNAPNVSGLARSIDDLGHQIADAR